MDDKLIVQRFAEWCAKWANEKPDKDFVEDYLNNYTITFKDDSHVWIDIHLGAFDHGAGNAQLIARKDRLAVDYEDEFTVFYHQGEFQNLPKDSND